MNNINPLTNKPEFDSVATAINKYVVNSKTQTPTERNTESDTAVRDLDTSFNGLIKHYIREAFC